MLRNIERHAGIRWVLGAEYGFPIGLALGSRIILGLWVALVGVLSMVISSWDPTGIGSTMYILAFQLNSWQSRSLVVWSLSLVNLISFPYARSWYVPRDNK